MARIHLACCSRHSKETSPANTHAHSRQLCSYEGECAQEAVVRFTTGRQQTSFVFWGVDNESMLMMQREGPFPGEQAEGTSLQVWKSQSGDPCTFACGCFEYPYRQVTPRRG